MRASPSRPAATKAMARASSSRRCVATIAATASRSDTEMFKILVTRKLPSAALKKLEEAADIDLYTGDAAISPDELRSRVADKDGLICLLTEAVDRALIDAAPKLKVISNVAVGYNNIDVPYAV